jgi:hypothetical protein
MGDSVTLQPNLPRPAVPVKKFDFPGELTAELSPNVQSSDGTTAYQLPLYLAAKPSIKLLDEKLELYVEPEAVVSAYAEKNGGKEFQWLAALTGGLVYTINPDSAVEVSPEIYLGASYATGNFPFLGPYFYLVNGGDVYGRAGLNLEPGSGFRFTPYGEFSQTYFRDSEIDGRDTRVRAGLSGVLAFGGDQPEKFKPVPNLHFDLGIVAWSDHYAASRDLRHRSSFKWTGSDLTAALSWDKLPYVVPSLRGGVSGSSHDNNMIVSPDGRPKFQDSFPLYYWFGLSLNFGPALEALIGR